MSYKRVTIEDVARAAGVSRQTVSRAINDQGEISSQTRARVLRIAQEMDYRPSSIARGLATRRTRTLGLVIPDVANPFFSDLARGAEHVAYSEGYNVFLCNTEEDPERESAVLQSLEDKRVDGIVLCSSRLDDSALHALVAHHPAVVLVNRRLGSSGQENGMGVVMLDDVAGGRMATRHLLSRGHRAVGFLAGPPASRSGQRRATGYRSAFDAADVPFRTAWMTPCVADVVGGQRSARGLLNRHPELEALFCYNDLVAVGALQACSELGRRVPDDVAIVGFDDIPLAALVTPSLTTCRVPRQELGIQAMRLLLDRIAGHAGEGSESVLLPELVIRTSAP